MAKIGDVLKVTRDDLNDFPKDTKDLIMDLQKEGWRASRSGSNHVVLLAPDGFTRITASRNKNSYKYLQEDLKRANAAHTRNIKEKSEDMLSEKHACPRENCPKFFNSEESLDLHIDVDHEGFLLCPEENCKETYARPQALARHRQVAHGYISPNRERRKAQEAKRAGRDILNDVMKTVDSGDFGLGDDSDTPIVSKMSRESTGRPLTEMEEAVEIANAGIPDPPVKSINGVVVKGDWKPVYDGEDIVGHSLYVEPEAKDVERIDFLDDRDSWVVDDPDMMSHPVNTLRQILNAVGLDMEVRVWRKK